MAYDRTTRLPYGSMWSDVAIIEAAANHSGPGCLQWPGRTNRGGYGLATITDRLVNAHRAVLERVAGPPPTPDHQASHTPVVCHNPGCMAPGHLAWRTAAQNAAHRRIDRCYAWERAGQLTLFPWPRSLDGI